MKVMLVNGSPHAKGNTFLALDEMRKVFEQEGIQAEIVQVGSKAVRGCIACRKCNELGKCVFDDAVNETAGLFEECDGIVVGSPVYYASANGNLVSYLDRLFFSTKFDKASLMTYCQLSDLDALITEREPAKEYVDYFEKHNVRLILP